MFVARNRFLKRVLLLPKTQMVLLASLYEASLRELKDLKGNRFNFAEAVNEFQSRERAALYFGFLFSEAEFHETWAEFKQEKALLSEEETKKLRDFVSGLYELLREKHGAKIAKFFEAFFSYLLTLHFIYDLYWAIGREPARLVEFLSDWVAIDSLDVDELGWVPQAVDSLCDLCSRWGDASAKQKEKLSRSIVVSVAEFARRLSEEGHVSMRALSASLAHVKPWLSGKPGRPRVDYSRAWKLKRESELSWSKVAQTIYDESPRLQAEFGKTRYVDLPLEHKVRLTSRLRIGVARYEQRQKLPQAKPNKQR